MNNLQNICNFKDIVFYTYLISHPVKWKFGLDRQMFSGKWGTKLHAEFPTNYPNVFIYSTYFHSKC